MRKEPTAPRGTASLDRQLEVGKILAQWEDLGRLDEDCQPVFVERHLCRLTAARQRRRHPVEGEAARVLEPEDRRQPGLLDVDLRRAPGRRMVDARRPLDRHAGARKAQHRPEVGGLAALEAGVDRHQGEARHRDGARRRQAQDPPVLAVELLALGERHRADEAGVVEQHAAGAEQEEAEVEEQEAEGGGAVLDPPDGALADLLRPVAEAPQSLDDRRRPKALGQLAREPRLRLRPGPQAGLRPRPEANPVPGGPGTGGDLRITICGAKPKAPWWRRR